MPGPENSITDQVAQNPSSNTESTASEHQHHHEGEKGAKASAMDHRAHPGPAIPKEFNVQQEGTKEERMKRMEELNK